MKHLWIIISIALFPFQALAVTPATQHILQYGSTFYDPTDTGAPSQTCAPGDVALSGNNVHDTFVFLVGKGLKDFQAAAIIGNLQQESGPKLDTSAVNPDGSGSTGIAQWLGSRLDGLKALAQKLGKPDTDLSVQLAFLWQELTTTEQGSLTALEATTDVTSATISFQNNFERCDKAFCMQDRRIQNAKDVLTLAQSNSWGSGASATSCSSPGGSATGAKIVQIALSQVGTNEGNTTNGGPSCKYQGTSCPQAWCADFVSWVYQQAGVPFTEGGDGGWRQAGAASLASWFQKHGTWIPNPGHAVPVTDPSAPQPGDVVYYPAGDGHVNIVVSYDGKTVKTVGGNQADSVSTVNFDVFGAGPNSGWGRLK